MSDKGREAQNRALDALAALSQDIQENGSDQYAVAPDETPTGITGQALSTDPAEPHPADVEYATDPAGGITGGALPLEDSGGTHETPTGITGQPLATDPEPHPADVEHSADPAGGITGGALPLEDSGGTHETPTGITGQPLATDPEPHPADGGYATDPVDTMPTRQGPQGDGLGFTDDKVNAEIEVSNYQAMKEAGLDVSDFAFAHYQGDPELLAVATGNGIATHLSPSDPGIADPQIPQNTPGFDL